MSIVGIKNLGQIQIDWKFGDYKLTEIINNALLEKKSNYNNSNENEKIFDDIFYNIGQYDDDCIADQYRILKENFHDLGQYDEEDMAYVEYRRAKRYMLSSPLKKFLDKTLDWIGEYGTNPLRIAGFMVIVLLAFALVFSIFPVMLDTSNSVIQQEHVIEGDLIINEIITQDSTIIKKQTKVFDLVIKWPVNFNRPLTAFYHSIVTFLTIGYGNVTPIGFWGILLSGLEGFLGMFLMSYFTVALVRKTLR